MHNVDRLTSKIYLQQIVPRDLHRAFAASPSTFCCCRDAARPGVSRSLVTLTSLRCGRTDWICVLQRGREGGASNPMRT